jgi:hypothetical protein
MVNHIQENIFRLIESTSFAWSTENIFIIGKGPSIDELIGFSLPDGLIINVNDSEKIIQGNLGVFSGNWVRHSLKDRGFNCQYYLAGKPLTSTVSHDLLPAIPLEFDTEELTLYRFGLDEYYDELFVLSNALKVCRHVASKTKKNQVCICLDLISLLPREKSVKV